MTSTLEKIKTLETSNSDFEWYPTTDEIINKMKQDIFTLFKKEILGTWRDNGFTSKGYDRKECCIMSFLDVGAGDGRILNSFKNDKYLSIENKYGIELAQPFAEDLILKDDIFLIGRDFFRTSLIDKHYSVIFSNPPYTQYISWTVRLLQESNFILMYLVLPVRWENNQEIMIHLNHYNTEKIGEYDFTHGDRPARARVNLIRIMNKKLDKETRYSKDDDKDEDSFDRWVKNHIGNFENNETKIAEEEKHLKIKEGAISDMIENYEYEMNSLLDAFKALVKLPSRIFNDLGLNKDKITKQLRENITKLKNTYWHFAFSKLNPIKKRLTHKTRQNLLNRMSEFETLDFNEDNIYSIILWVIKNFNKYTSEQILDVFDKLTKPDYIKAYKSNLHWLKDDWRYNNWFMGKGKPEKYILDYRIVTHCYVSKYDENDSIIEDLKVICESLGYPVPDFQYTDYTQNGKLQEFTTRYIRENKNYTNKPEIAFTTRLYKNNNLHLKINEKIMLRFNVEVARLRNWINSPDDIAREYDVSQDEAIKLWKEPSLLKLAHSDILQLGFEPTEQKTA
jgi:hypothetical protein